MYKANKDQVNVFGLQTQYGGGKTTGFALVYDSPEALKKFEPHYRLVRVGFASKIEKPSRQQRTSTLQSRVAGCISGCKNDTDEVVYRQATQEQTKDSPRYGKGQGCEEEEGRINDALPGVCGRWRHLGFCWIWDGLHVCTLPHWLSVSCIGGGSKEQWCDFNRIWPLQSNKGVCLSDTMIIHVYRTP